MKFRAAVEWTGPDYLVHSFAHQEVVGQPTIKTVVTFRGTKTLISLVDTFPTAAAALAAVSKLQHRLPHLPGGDLEIYLDDGTGFESRNEFIAHQEEVLAVLMTGAGAVI